MTVADFLVLTQTYTLPYLVLLKKKDIVQRIAYARGQGSTAWSTCMDSANISSILGLLLVQQSNDLEISTMSLLCEVSEEFRQVDLASLARIEPHLIAFELLKAAGDEEGKSARVWLIQSQVMPLADYSL